MLDMYLGLEGYTGSAEEAFDLPLPASAGGIGLTEPDLDEIRRMRRTKSRSLFGERVLEVCAAADTVFMALHGRCGEDGRVAGRVRPYGHTLHGQRLSRERRRDG